MAICYIHENLLKNREEIYITCAIFCEASDTIDHRMLLHKQERINREMKISFLWNKIIAVCIKKN